MKLDRNVNLFGKGKYALLNLRTNKIEWGRPGSEDEFFAIKLKDRHARVALIAYANSVKASDPEFAEEVSELANRAGVNSPFCKEPD